ncbi:Uncharacterised protein r2_g4064 [Pycnogonum litorale]
MSKQFKIRDVVTSYNYYSEQCATVKTSNRIVSSGCMKNEQLENIYSASQRQHLLIDDNTDDFYWRLSSSLVEIERI